MALKRDALFWDAFSSLSAKMVQVVELLRKMLDDPASATSIAAELKKVEEAADEDTHRVVVNLHKTWITPLDRDEIHTLATTQDDVIDNVNEAADKLALYEVEFVPPEAIEIGETLQRCATTLQKLVAGLRNIQDAEALLGMCHAVGRLEREADDQYRRALAALFKADLDPIDIMKWRDIIEALERAADSAEDVANVVEGIVLEHS